MASIFDLIIELFMKMPWFKSKKSNSLGDAKAIARNDGQAQALNSSAVGGDLVGRDKITYQNVPPDPVGQLTPRDLVQRVISEAKDNVARKGHSRKFCEHTFVEAAYVSNHFMNWPETAQQAVNNYRQRLQAGSLINDKYFSSYFVPDTQLVISELQMMLDTDCDAFIIHPI